MYIFHDAGNFSWLVVLPRVAKECLLSLLYQKHRMPGFSAPAAGLTVCWLDGEGPRGPNSGSHREVSFARGRCPERISTRVRTQSRGPGCREWRASLVLAGPNCSSRGRGDGDRSQHRGPLRPLPASRSRARGSGDAQGPARLPGSSTLAAFVCRVLRAGA